MNWNFDTEFLTIVAFDIAKTFRRNKQFVECLQVKKKSNFHIIDNMKKPACVSKQDGHLISCLCLYLAAFPQIIRLPLLSIFVLRLSPFDEFFLVDFLIIMGEQSGSGMAGFLYKKQFEFICIFGLEFIHFRSTMQGVKETSFFF